MFLLIRVGVMAVDSFQTIAIITTMRGSILPPLFQILMGVVQSFNLDPPEGEKKATTSWPFLIFEN